MDGTLQTTSDIVQVASVIPEDTVAPSMAELKVQQQPDGQTAKATWTPTDEKTAAADLSYFYAIDKPIDQWDDPDVVFAGQLATPESAFDISSLSEGEHTFNLAAFDAEGNGGDTLVSFKTGSPDFSTRTAYARPAFFPLLGPKIADF